MENFRKFAVHEVAFRDTTVMVGANNAGKSTIVEALRLTSFVTNRYRSLNYQRTPRWVTEPVGPMGVVPSLRDLSTDLTTLFHAYSDPPARIEAEFSDGSCVTTYVGADQAVFSVVRASGAGVITSKAEAFRTELPRVAVLHQVAPVDRFEALREPLTVRRSMDSPLAPAHFRNQLLLADKSEFEDFRALAEETWPGLQIQTLERPPPGSDEPVRLLVRDGGFVGELAAMGHGLQMWLQVMWFLARNGDAGVVVVDEPDVYMHADLQRRLSRIVGRMAPQFIVATHSVEIIAESSPESVLVVDSARRRSVFATSVDGVQRVVDEVGSVTNLQLARLANARKCLLVEGSDATVLKQIHDLLFPRSDSLAAVPTIEVGGWGGWERSIGVAQLLRNTAGASIPAYCLFDADYFPAEVVVDRYAKAAEIGLRLHVWTMKEIENYLLVPAAIQRAVAKRLGETSSGAPDAETIRARMEQIIANLSSSVVEEFATQYQQRERGVGFKAAKQWASRIAAARVAEMETALGVVSGKDVLKQLSRWCHEEYGTGFNPMQVAAAIRSSELHPELAQVVSAVESGAPFDEIAAEKWVGRAAAEAVEQ